MAEINYDAEVAIPEGISISVEGSLVLVKGPKAEARKSFENPRLEIKVEGERVVVRCMSRKTSLRDKMSINTIASHIRNLIKGVQEGFHAKVRVLSGHFPIVASVEGNVVSIKNFLGGKVPRKTVLMHGVKAVVQGDIISLEGTEKEAVAQSAAKIEALTRITDKDRRVFQDGCYIIEKPGGKKV